MDASRWLWDISIHALLAESDDEEVLAAIATLKFLSTLSLRRATRVRCRVGSVRPSFLSTLSLRRATVQGALVVLVTRISIHALLAESDGA